MTRVDGPWNFLLLLGGPWTYFVDALGKVQ